MILTGWGRLAWGTCLILIIVALPALVAGASLDAPVRLGEQERLAAAAAQRDPTFAELFLRLCAPPSVDDGSVGGEAALRQVGEARIAQFVGVLACAMLGYLVCALANGRASALLANLCFAALPPVAVDGHVLRAETSVVMLHLLALLLAQLLAMSQLPAAARIRRASGVALAVTSALFVGMAVASMPTMGVVLLFPSGLAILSAILVAQRMWRPLKRRSVAAWPARAAARRLWPYVGFALLSMMCATLLLVAAGRPGDSGPSPCAGSLLPQSTPAAVVLVSLAGLGALRALLRAGRRLGVQGRIGPDAVLLAYSASALVHRGLHGANSDALVAALPFAWLLAEGAKHACLIVAARFR